MLITKCVLSVLLLKLLKCKQQLTGEIGIIDLNAVNRLMITSAATQPAPLS